MGRCGICIHSIKTIIKQRTPFDSEYDAFGVPNSVAPCEKVQWKCTVEPKHWVVVDENRPGCRQFIMDATQEFLEPDLDRLCIQGANG